MASLEEFKTLLKENPDEAFKQYLLAIDEVSFYWQDADSGVRANAGMRFIEWRFEEPNIVKMYPSQNEVDSIGKKIYYLPWENKKVTKVTLDGDSPGFFLTSQFTNCRFTIQFHDGLGKTVTVMHIAGDVIGGGGFTGGNTRNQMESDATTITPTRTRRLSVSKPEPGVKGASWKKYEASSADTAYYDSQAVVFGYRKKNDCWVFYAQNQGGELGLLRLQD